MERSRPRLILLDLMMPEMDGFEFVAQVRQRVEWRSIPIVVLIAYDLDAEERRKLNGGVETIIQKAGDTPEALLLQLRDFLCDYPAPGAMKISLEKR
jgi:CheY-like chemotaxis protein